MTTRSNLTFADEVFIGRANHNRASSASGARGIRVLTLTKHESSPATLDANGIAEAQAVAGAGNLALDGALVVDGVAINDVARNVTITSSGAGDTTQTATVTGTDIHGGPVVETIAFNGAATIAGKKAFKTVTAIAISAALAGNGSAGNGDVIGLPYHLAKKAYSHGVWFNDTLDGSATIVAGVTTTATATTGDVFGTVDPNSACNGSVVIVWFYVDGSSNASAFGVDQYAG